MSKIKTIILTICSLAAFAFFAAQAMAVTSSDAGGATATPTSSSTTSPNPTYDPCHPEKIGGTPLTKRQLNNCQACQQAGNNDCLQKNPIVIDLNVLVNVLTGAVALVVIGVLIVGGIQYALAGGNANAVTAAKKRIVNALVALIAFFFIWAFLQWLIPGGV